MPRFRIAAIMLAATICAALPGRALAGWKLVPAGQAISFSGMTVIPHSDWNQDSKKPGKQGQAWTHDGFELNGLELFAGIPSGQPLYKEHSKRLNPMPKFDNKSLLPELADLFERSFRVQNRLTDFVVDESAPSMLGGKQALRVRYRYTFPNDELVRRGEVRLAVVEGKLFAVNFYAPDLHYFQTGLAEAEAIMDAAKF